MLSEIDDKAADIARREIFDRVLNDAAAMQKLGRIFVEQIIAEEAVGEKLGEEPLQEERIFAAAPRQPHRSKRPPPSPAIEGIIAGGLLAPVLPPQSEPQH